MHSRTFRRTTLSLTVAAATLVASVAAPAYARPQDGRQDTGARPAIGTGPVSDITDGLARHIAGSLADPATADRVVSAVAAGPVDLAALDLGPHFARTVREANRGVLTAKGLPPAGHSLLRVRLAHPGADGVLERGEIPLVAATPTDDTVTDVTAYDQTGASVLTSIVRTPQRPVLVVEVDVAKALPMGLQLMRDTLSARGVRGATPTNTTATASMSAAGGYWATKVNAIRLSDDKEPWIKGGAEIYNIVGGFGLDGKAKIDIVQMPYLDHDGQTYYPNQLLVHYSAYKYNLADVVMMEDDGDTNYLQLAQAIASALLFIVDGGVYTPLVNAILGALPTSWWTDDPDYVDSWYTLATSSSGRRNGAAGNGWMDVVPYWVQAF